jgi:L-ascorbate metabolism protein UlaG (beta-lactamase superfamily)
LLVQFELEGITVLTDPVFHDLNLVLYPRKTRPACSPRDLPPIDVIVISHNHRDHVDEAALRWLAKQQPLILVPEGDGQLMRSWGFLKVQEHSTWAETRIPFQRAPLQSCDEHASSVSEEGFGGYVGLVSVPANHWSCRSLNDANLSLFLGWVMYSSVGTGSVYFAGDTALLAEQDVRDITVTAVSKGVYPPIVINLQPGGPNHERATMEGTHTSAADGVFNHFQHVLMATQLERQDGCSFDRFLELCSSYLTVFMHHNVFELGIDRFNEALFVQRHLLNALAVLQGVEESALESPIEEPIPGFVHDVAASLLELLDSCGIEHRLTDASSDHLTHFSALVEERVISPKIGSCTFVPYPYA